ARLRRGLARERRGRAGQLQRPRPDRHLRRPPGRRARGRGGEGGRREARRPAPRQRRVPLPADGVRPRRARGDAGDPGGPRAALPRLPQRHRRADDGPRRDPPAAPRAAHRARPLGADARGHARRRRRPLRRGRQRQRALGPRQAHARPRRRGRHGRHGPRTRNPLTWWGHGAPCPHALHLMHLDLTGKNALVTGGTRGIGRAIVDALAAAGANVAFTYRSSAEAADALKRDLEGRGTRCLAFQGDAADVAHAQEAVSAVVDAWGSLDVLVNNAGVTRDTLLLRMSEEDWDAVLDTNLKGVFAFCKAAYRPMMKQRSGSIVNISSIAGVEGNPGQTNYAAS